ncbi:SNF2-related protein [Clostridium sp. C2-6-12]|uniref:DEAD/DEAH box helicase n=1 Tax=Clostridium sp. C2-6-12 TaxID=2698832 RepID=UPI00136E8AD8|nr:SNF2-related protein [Clostridium sp. C2-6-12]
MKISELEKLILDNASKLNLTRGKEMLQGRELPKVSIKKVENNYNIYGSFTSDNKIQSCNSHLKINVINKKIDLAKCQCNNSIEFGSKNNIYMCEHLVALGLIFIQQIKKKMNKTEQEKDNLREDKKLLLNLPKLTDIHENTKMDLNDFINNINKNKKKLNLNLSLKETFQEERDYFELSIFIGNNTMYPISNIEEFILSLYNSKEYYIGKGLIYKKEEYYFSKEDEEILEYLYEYILTLNDVKSSIRIHKEVLRRFLLIAASNKIKFNYNYQTYICDIKHEDLPISFVLKQVNGEYVLTTKKIFPIPLNNKMDVFFFDRKIYIPSEIQNNLYKLFYGTLKENNKFTFPKNIAIEELYNLIICLNTMTKDLIIDEVIIENIANSIKVDFEFEKRENDSYCNVKMYLNNREFSYEEILSSSNSIIKKSKKMRTIESELNKNRFYYKDGTFIFYGNDEDYYLFLKEKINDLKKLGEIKVLSDNEKYFKLYKGNISDLKLKEEGEKYFKFSFNLEGINNRQLNQILSAYNNKQRYIKLEDNVFIDLENEELIEFIKLIEALNINVNENKDEYKLELNKLYYLNNKLNEKQINLLQGREILNKALKKMDKLNSEAFEIPKELKGILRKYQLEGFNWFKSLSFLGLGGILADEMGLGKTIQTIAFLLSEKNTHSLIVSPTSLIYNWKQEIEKFAPTLSVGIVHGSKNERIQVLNNIFEYDIIITTYGTLKNDISNYENIMFDYLILDEGQNVNNSETQNAKVIREINSKSRFILTGTPIENNLEELWALFDFVMPGYLYSKQDFTSKFIKQEEKYIEDLKLLINPYILRRTKNQVIKEIPEKIEKKFLVPMTEAQKNLYKTFIKEIQDNFNNDQLDKNNISIFSYLTKLRQICLDPSVIFDEYNGGSGKINIAKELILNNIKEHKILLFSQFTSVLAKLSLALEAENINYSYLDGSTASKDRIKLVNEFNNNEDIKVFLISLKAGGTGLNLTSADIVIHFDPWWNLSVEDQATDRAHRIGQKHIVQVIKLIAKDTIEEKIILLQEDKKELINKVITGDLKEGNVVSKITNKEILNLILS